MRLRTSSILALFPLSLLALEASASAQTPAQTPAQTLPSIDARTWRPSSDPAAGLVLEPVATQGDWNWSAGVWINYTHHPVALRNVGSDVIAYRPVSSLLGLDATMNLGLGSRASIGLGVPLVLYQDGTSPLPASVATSKLPQSAIGDLAIYGKGVIVPNKDGGIGVAALGALTLPTGDRASFAGEGAATVGARLLVEYTLVVASIQASAGYTLRTSHRVWPDPIAGGVTFGDEIPWSIGVSLKPDLFKLDSSNRQRWDLAFHGALPAGPVLPFGGGDPGSAKLSSALLALSDRVDIGHYRDVYFVGGGEIGLNDAVGVPAFRIVASIGWAPRSHDMDKDGVPDDVDQCPEIPEDRDGFEDSDGCPEIDDDDDGILDKEDACPRVPGVPSEDPKKNGCPAIDRDKDGVADDVDACPDVKGIERRDPARNGCPAALDRDKDGVPDDVDRCPDQPEDKDGNEDDDGCPDPDDDRDGISDREDACPRVAGQPTNDPKTNGCPSIDRDGDTFDDTLDKCPSEAETFNGVKDDDGCPDEGGKPLVIVDETKETMRLAIPIKLGGTAESPEIDPASFGTVRAIGLELNRHRTWSIGIGTRPAGATEAETRASLVKSAAIAKVLVLLTHREGAAEAVAWDAVKKLPGSEGGSGILVLHGTNSTKDDAKPLAPVPVPAPTPVPAPPSAPAKATP